ncbi:hypothetical protein RJ641_025660 [Dillenia turbinata]|uniref:Protein PRD1 n=1 Tax=Dillenia turbinata TaxID=194707 RepID=A0AAN8W1C7_9MAGN
MLLEEFSQIPNEEDEAGDYYLITDSTPFIDDPKLTPCSQGHQPSLKLQTVEGGTICLLCFSNLISDSSSPTFHVTYALSQLSQALSQPQFLQSLLMFHSHFLISPLLRALSSFDDDPIADQITNLIVRLSESGGSSVFGDFLMRITDQLSSGSLAWSRRQVYTLHCLGILLKCQTVNPQAHIRDLDALISNLVEGLELPSEEIRGEILFVLYKLSNLNFAPGENDVAGVFLSFSPTLFRLSLDALVKTQSDAVWLNCVGLLTVLIKRGFLESASVNVKKYSDPCGVDDFMQVKEWGVHESPLNSLFAEAIKGPLLSSDNQVQISTLNFILLLLSRDVNPVSLAQVLVQENIADYVFEILRLSELKDPAISSCVQVLDLLSADEQSFRHRLAIGFTTLIPVLNYVASVPFHPIQTCLLKVVWNFISNCPGAVSVSHLEELCVALSGMVRRYGDGGMGMPPETFIIACSIFVALMKSPSSHGSSAFAASIQEASKLAILSCLKLSEKDPLQFLHSLYLLKEAYEFTHRENDNSNSSVLELRSCVLNVCETYILPWLLTAIHEVEDEETILGVLETFHSILVLDSDFQVTKFANSMISSSWFSFSFECLGLFPTERLKCRVFQILSSMVDVTMGNDSGQPIRDASSHLPSDPTDMLFLLGQKSLDNLELQLCQYAVLLILHISSLYDERLADDKLVLASLEQYILINGNNFVYEMTESSVLEQLVNLYGLYRGLGKLSYQIPYSLEAEKVLFQMLFEKEWDLASIRIHSKSLKWLFQQDKIVKPLFHQILKFCRCYSSDGSNIVIHSNGNQNLDVYAIAKLVVEADNFAATLLVSLLSQLLESEGQWHEIGSVLNLMTIIINIFPTAADQLCLHGLVNTVHSTYYLNNHSSSQTSMAILLLLFNILRSVHSAVLSDSEAWLAVTTKLIDSVLATVTVDNWNMESLLTASILSLVLHHSSNQSLVEASKAILINTSLASIIKNTTCAACSAGPILTDHDEGTSTGETLVYILLLQYFSLRSLNAVLPGQVDWQYFLDSSEEMQPFLISIPCHDLCRLMHFGAPPVKLVASYCLLELFTIISNEKNVEKEFKCSKEYLNSIMAVLEGFVFYDDVRVALNCALCLSMYLEWEILDVQDIRITAQDHWCRLIIGEMTMSLAVPHLASKSNLNHQKPALHVALALLKGRRPPTWMRSVIDDTCITGMIENLSAGNMSVEIVLLFQELQRNGFLKMEHVGNLNRVFQACRRHSYSSAQDGCVEEHAEKVIAFPGDMRKVCQFLIHLMSSGSSSIMNPGGTRGEKKRLLDEIEIFFSSLTELRED